jgi:trans-aconitate methyltransferase
MSFQRNNQPFSDSVPGLYGSLASYYDTLRNIVGLPSPQFYEDLITEDMHSVLELGCGTGIVTIALADRLMEQHRSLAQTRIVGLDASSEMLQIARRRDDRIEWVKGDMRDPPITGRFDLVVCYYNTLQYLVTEQDVGQTFNAVRSMLTPRGLFAFDIYQPNFEYLKKPRTDQLIRSTVDTEGRALELREDACYDPALRVLRLDWRLLCQEPQGSVILACARQYVGQYTAADIDRLLKEAGLKMLARFGDLDRSHFTPRSKRQVIVCGRR